MTKDEFFQLVASQGIEEAFRQLPAHHDIELLQMRVQNLRQDFMEGLISVHTAIMECNRIAMALLPMLEKAGTTQLPEQEVADIQMISKAVKELLGISPEEAAAAQATEHTSQKKIAEARRLYDQGFQSTAKENYSPTPVEDIPAHGQLKELLAMGETLQLLRHIQGLAAGTKHQSEAENLVNLHQQMEHGVKYGLGTYETATRMHTRIISGLLALLNQLSRPAEKKNEGEKPVKSWWQKLSGKKN
ncbi:MAG: hypothetical protein SGI94_01040 [Saprospiraceae bacterium]|nr:hypothetical protein [Saprospiraceae bacterium]